MESKNSKLNLKCKTLDEEPRITKSKITLNKITAMEKGIDFRKFLTIRKMHREKY